MALINTNTANKITCSDLSSSTVKSMIFENYGLSILEGSKTLFSLLLKDLFFPVNSYQFSEFKIGASGSIMLDPGNISNANGDVTAIVIVVKYPTKDAGDVALTETDKYINYTYSSNSQTYPIGKMMLLSGTDSPNNGWNLMGSPGGLVLTNPHSNFDVDVKVLLIS